MLAAGRAARLLWMGGGIDAFSGSRQVRRDCCTWWRPWGSSTAGIQLYIVLTDTLLYEISTERLRDRVLLCDQDARGLDSMIAASLAKAREAGDEWVERSEALRWEILRGESARSAPRFAMKRSFTLQDILDTLAEVGDACLSHDTAMGRLGSVVHAPRDEAGFSRIRGMDKRSFFDYLQAHLSSPGLLEALPMEARNGFMKVAAEHGLTPSPRFIPDRGWLAYGIELAGRAYVPWKLWRVGDQEADAHKPANPFFDNLYIAFMAIGDGIISCDKDLLALSWVCWPEKRRHILGYDSANHQPTQFRPDWV
jgi:hypothetical protein